MQISQVLQRHVEDSVLDIFPGDPQAAFSPIPPTASVQSIDSKVDDHAGLLAGDSLRRGLYGAVGSAPRPPASSLAFSLNMSAASALSD